MKLNTRVCIGVAAIPDSVGMAIGALLVTLWHAFAPRVIGRNTR